MNNPNNNDTMTTPKNPNARYWVCIIGPIERDQLPMGADLPPRIAARNAVFDMTGDGEVTCNSGWCGEVEYQRIMNAKYKQNAEL
jgi:hypothetical protein